MLIISLIILLLSNSITLRRDKSILFSRATITILLIATFITYDNLYFLFLNKGIGIFGGLLHTTYTTNVFHIFILLINSVILLLTSFYTRKVWLKEYSSIDKLLFSKSTFYQTIIINKTEQGMPIKYSLTVLFILTGSILQIFVGFFFVGFSFVGFSFVGFFLIGLYLPISAYLIFIGLNFKALGYLLAGTYKTQVVLNVFGDPLVKTQLFSVYSKVVEYIFMLKDWYKQWYTALKTAIVIIGYFITVMIGLNSNCGIILGIFILTLILFLPNIFKLIGDLKIKQDLYAIKIFMFFGVLYIGILYFFTDWATTTNFKTNFPMFCNIQVFLLYTFICQMVINLIYGEREKDLFSKIKNKLKELWPIFKNNPLYFLCIGIVILFVLWLVNWSCNSLGISICTNQGWFPYIISILTRISFIKLIISLCSLFVTKNVKEWYNIVGMSPLVLLILIPTSLCYYFCIIPQLTQLNCVIVDRIGSILSNIKELYINVKSTIVGRIDSILGYIKELWVELDLKIVFTKIKYIGEKLIGMGNRPAQLGKFLVQWANWVLGDKLESITKKSYLCTSYTPVNFIDSCSARLRANLRHWDFVKSMPKILPVRIFTPVSSGGNYNDLIFVTHSLKTLFCSICIYIKDYNIIELYNVMEALENKTVNFNIKAPEGIVKVSLSKHYVDLELLNSYDKPWYMRFEPKEYAKGFFNKHDDKSNGILNSFDYRSSLFHLTNPNRSGKNLVVNMQNETIYDDPNTPQGGDNQEEPSSINTTGEPLMDKGKKRALDATEDFNLYKSKKIALDNSTSDYVNSEGVQDNSSAYMGSEISNTITDEDIMEDATSDYVDTEGVQENSFANLEGKPNTIKSNDFTEDGLNFESIHHKLTKAMEDGGLNKTDRINKLDFESKTLKTKFYDTIKTLKLINSKQAGATRIQTLINALEKFVDITYTNANSIKRDDYMENGFFDNYTIYMKIFNLIKDGVVKKEDYLGKLQFEPESLRDDFYKKIKAYELTNYKHVSNTIIATLLNTLKKKVDVMFFSQFHITRDDFSDRDFHYNIIYSKISNLIENGEVDKEDYISKLKFRPPNLKDDFYDKIKALGLIKNKRVFGTLIGTLLKRLENFIDITYTNANSIKKEDLLDESLNYNSIYDKISNLMESGEIKSKDKFSKLPFEPESLRGDFYARIKALELTNPKTVPSTIIGTFQETLKEKIDVVLFNQFHITRDDFSDKDFHYNIIYSKISNLIKNGKVDKEDSISKLKFRPPNLKNDFYDRIKALELINNKRVFATKIETFLKRLENFIDITYTNANSITKYDFSDKDFKYNIIYSKISNFIELGEVKKEDYLGKLQFEPASIRGDFYARIKALKLTYSKHVSSTKIETLLKRLKVEMDINNPNRITREDFSDKDF